MHEPMTSTTKAALLPVEQVDRELYLKLRIFHTCEDDMILAGWADGGEEMQAIVAHRLNRRPALPDDVGAVVERLRGLLAKAEIASLIADAHHTVDYAGREHGWLRCKGELVPLGAIVLRPEGVPQDQGRARLDLLAEALNALPGLLDLIQTLSADREGVEAALKVAHEALLNYACHGGPDLPCKRAAYQCRAECGKQAGDALLAISAIRERGGR